MSTLLSSLGRWSYRHPWRVLVSWLLALGLAGAGAVVLGAGTDNTFTIPGTESQAGLEQLSRSFPQASGTNAQFIVVAADGDEITDAAYRDRIEDAVDELSDLHGVLAVTSPYDKLVTGMVSDDETAAIVRLQFKGQSSDVTPETKHALTEAVDDLSAELPAGSQTSLGGDLFAMSIPGVTLTEAVGLLVALLVLIVTFRSFVVAGLPLLTAILGVGISMAGIFTATAFATVSSTTPLLALMLGLAVGIDYALFIMARHQDQVREGTDPEESASRAVGTAGSAVVFAGVTVLIALIGLGFAGIPFLTTMGVAASVAVAIAVAIAVTLTPAILGFMKGRIAGRPRRERKPSKRAAAARKQPRERVPFSRRWVTGVTKRPVLVSLVVILGLGIVAVPALSLNLALPNAGVLPKDSEARQSYDLVGEHFGPGFNGPLILTGTIVTSTDPLGLMEDLGDAVAKVDGVKEVALSTPNETADTGIVQIIPETAPDDPATADLVRELRSHHDEWLEKFGIDLKVTGFTAVAIDISDQLGRALLPFGIFVIGLSLILLTIVFRSLWVPVTAALGYLLSIIAAFGVVAAVFEWGWFADALHVAKVGPIISFMPIVLMGVLFGLAMDYQVFLVSRMREDYVHDPASKERTTRREAALRAVRSGFTGSAKVVTAAGLIMFAVFVAFVPEGDSSLKPIALGLAAGIAIDAFLVRMTLIPALMAILGERAWRIPAWLERILPSVDIEGEAVERERHLAAWPGDDSVVAADDLVLADAGIDGLRLRVAPGAAAVLTGASPAALRALALALAGRVTPDDGRLRVAGHLLPGRAAWVRAHVGAVIATDAGAAASDLAEALRGRPALVVIDGADRLPSAARDQLAARLRDADAGTALVLTAGSAESAQAILAEAGRPAASVIRLDEPAEPEPAPADHDATADRMTLSIERSRSRKPITWFTILGILLLPAAIGGILVAALQDPTERLDSMTAAIVNLDEPVKVDGQLAPLGRQLASGLVEGSDDLDSNLTWVISNEDDAAEGLADGTYQAVITIPKDFSASATSAGTAISEGGGAASDKAEKATIKVTTPEDGLVADDLITGQIAAVAASTMGTKLSEATMENVLVGFTTIGDQIGEAADGAATLANGARDAATGAAALPGGATQLASGASELGNGASSLANGLDTIGGKTREAAAGAGQLGTGLTGGAAQLDTQAADVAKLVGGIQAGTSAAKDAAGKTAALAQQLGAMAAQCDPTTSGELCAQLATAASDAGAAAKSAGTASGTLDAVAPGVAALPAGFSTLAGTLRDAGSGATALSTGLTQLADQGIGASAAGARKLSDGAGQLSGGATQLADGATQLATGLDTLATGTGDLAGGLRTASDSLPSFDDAQSSSLASVIADPVSADSPASTVFGPTAIPLLAAVVLWFGALASFLVMRAHTARTLTSRRSSASLTLRSFAPAALIGAGQGVLVALIVQFVAKYDAAAWWAFAGTAVLAGIVFAAVNQALVALFGGIGRWVSALIGVLAVATGIISTVPDWLAGIAAALPTAPAFAGLISANGAAAAALIVWGVLSLIATTVVVAMRRTTSAKAVLAGA